MAILGKSVGFETDEESDEWVGPKVVSSKGNGADDRDLDPDLVRILEPDMVIDARGGERDGGIWYGLG
jgi:hypothetical protein